MLCALGIVISMVISFDGYIIDNYYNAKQGITVICGKYLEKLSSVLQ
jgi:hypothetical protein